MTGRDPASRLRVLLTAEESRGAVIAVLAPHMDPETMRVAARAAAFAETAGLPDAGRALASLAARMVELDSVEVMADVGPLLVTHAQSSLALPLARRVELGYVRAELIGALAGSIPDVWLALKLVEEAADAGATEGRLGESLAGVAREVRTPEQADAVLAALLARPTYALPRALTELAGELAPEGAAEAVTAIAGEPVSDDALRALAALIPRLSEPDRGQRLWEIADLVAARSPIVRADVACALAEELPVPEREGWLDMALAALLEELDSVARDVIWMERLDVAGAVGRAAALLGDREREQLLAVIHRLTEQIEGDWRAPALREIAAALPESSRADLVARAAAWARRLPDAPNDRGRPSRSGELASLAELVPADSALAAEIAATAPSRPSPEEAARAIASELAADELRSELKAVLGGLTGAQAPPRAFEESFLGGQRALPVVNTGFADTDAPDRDRAPEEPLATATECFFWLEVSERRARSIERDSLPLPEQLPAGARLDVVLFPVSGGVSVLGRTTGELTLLPDRSAWVSRPAAPAPHDPALELRRLLFAVRTPPTRGTIELRCSIYCRQVLVQSRLISAEVGATEKRISLSSQLDYALTQELEPALMDAVSEHDLSVMVNGNDLGTHNIHLLAAGETEPFARTAVFEAGTLEAAIDQTRRALRKAAFGSPDPWRQGDSYLYGGDLDLARLCRDLLDLAAKGRRNYDECVNRLAGDYGAAVALEEKLRRPARIQIASRRHASLLIPAAIFYDRPLDSPHPGVRVCESFLEALVGDAPLEQSPCFKGECPTHGDLYSACPSGFWGFRHDLGLPVSLAPDGTGDEPDVAAFDIAYEDHPELGVAVSADVRFTLRDGHVKALHDLRPDLGWRYASTRAEALALLREQGAHVVYLYCHGGVADGVPFLGLGGVDEPGITSDLIRSYGIRWTRPRPLVFINGCETTAVEPDQAFEFVSRLVENAAAAGVMGTEITNFEPLAGSFALECLRRFFAGESIGAAVRHARLALLKAGNPLGLIYIPFVLPTLRLVRAHEVAEG